MKNRDHVSNTRTAALVITAAIALTVGLAIWKIQPPAARSATAPADQFSAERAMAHLRAIAVRPHPVGTAEHARVRDYIVGQLRAVGLRPEVQRAESLTSSRRMTRSAVVRNIVAVRRGTGGGRAVLLAAHYDTAPTAPGANDDGAPVAAILEALRALQSHPPLKNDLVVLIADGEELGLLGAQAFLDQSPLSRSVGFVMNMEARGSSGPAVMFETGDENGWVVREFDRAVKPSFATSLTYALYKKLPNNTDFSLLKTRAGGGLNFAHAGSVVDYHASTDDIDHLDSRVLQHHCDNTLAVLLHFGNIPLDGIRRPDVVFFSFIQPGLVIYPVTWCIPLAGLATLLFILVLFRGVRSGRMTVGKVVLGALSWLARLAVAGTAVFFLWRLLGPLRPEYGRFYLHTVHHEGWFLAGFLALAVAAAFPFQKPLISRLGALNLATGGLLLWVAGLWAAALLLPAGSHLLLWPLVFSLLGLMVLPERESAGAMSWKGVLIAAAALVPGVFLFTQLFYLLFMMLGNAVAAGLAALVVLLAASSQLPLATLAGRRPRLVPVAALVLAVGCLLTALCETSPTPQRPLPVSLLYACEGDDGTARWLTVGTPTDAWRKQFFSTGADSRTVPRFLPFPGAPEYLTAPAPVVQLSRLEVERLAGTSGAVPQAGVLDLQVRPTPGQMSMILNPERPGSAVEARLSGRLLETRDVSVWPLVLHGYGDGPVDLQLKTVGPGPFRLRVVEVFPGLPLSAGPGFSPRPPGLIPAPFDWTDLSLAGRTFSFDP